MRWHLPSLLRRANVFRGGGGGDWSHNDFDAFGGEEIWFWGVSFQLTGRKSYGRADSLEDAKAAFRLEYERWLKEAGDGKRNH